MTGADRYHGGRRRHAPRMWTLTPRLLMRLVGLHLLVTRSQLVTNFDSSGELDTVPDDRLRDLVADVAARTLELCAQERDPARAYDRAVAELAPEWRRR